MTICTRSPAPVSAGVPRPRFAEMAVSVAIVDHDEGAVALGEIADLLQLRHIAVHGEDAVGRDQLEARAVRVGLLQPRLQLVHVGVGEAVALCLAEPNPVDDRGVVQRVGDDGVLGRKQRLEHAAVGIEAGGEEDRVILAEPFGDPLLEAAMQSLRAADEADRGHAEPELVECLARCGDDIGMVGEAEIVVGAEVQELALPALRALDRGCGCAPIAAS